MTWSSKINNTLGKIEASITLFSITNNNLTTLHSQPYHYQILDQVIELTGKAQKEWEKYKKRTSDFINKADTKQRLDTEKV